MYASQTKRLCVRGAPSDESRVQHHSSASAEATISNQELSNQSHQEQQSILTPSSPSLRRKSNSSVDSSNMTASATGILSNNNSANNIQTAQASTSTVIPSTSPSHHTTSSLDSNPNIATTAIAVAENLLGESAEHDLINKLASETLEERRLKLILSIRNLITACNKKKDSIVNNPNFSKVVDLIDDEELRSTTVKAQLALLLCSIAKSGEHNVRVLNESLVDDRIFNLLLSSHDENLIEACLRCMRALMSWPGVSRTWLIYEYESICGAKNVKNKGDLTNSNNIQRIVSYAQTSNSFIIEECIAEIFAATCNRSKDQALLYKAQALDCVSQLLESPSNSVIMAALDWLTQLCLRNQLISTEASKARCPSGTSILDRLTLLMSKDKWCEMQFFAARCFAHIYRAIGTENMKDDFRIISHVLPTLVRMVHKDKAPHLRIKSAECIAYLIERETPLQNTASFCDHLIDSLASMLEYEQNSTLSPKSCPLPQYRIPRLQVRGISWFNAALQEPPLDLTPIATIEHPKTDETTPELTNATESFSIGDDANLELCQEMKRAAFLALASLASNLEPIRTKIFNTCSVMQNLVKSLTESDTKTLKSVLTCLLSLSRSVQQLRTSFAENNVYCALKNLLSTTSNEVLILVLAILCNISLDFSPGKQHFLDTKTIDILCSLTRKSDSILRLHGIWILMNMVYQLKDQNLKFQILRSLDITHVLSLLETEEDEEIVLKTLGFLRNLLSQKLHIDAIMNNHGDQIMQSMLRMLDKPSSSRIREQTLCVLTNIADGTDSKAYLMKNRQVLTYLTRVMNDEQGGDLRLAAICCITNLAHKDYEGSIDRRNEMKKLGIEDKLKSMLNTKDPALSDRVRTAYNQFLIGSDDKYVN